MKFRFSLVFMFCGLVLPMWLPLCSVARGTADGQSFAAPGAERGLGGAAYDYSKIWREKLGRGLVAVRQDKDTVMVSWRFLSSDADAVAFDLYRDGKRLNKRPIDGATWWKDAVAESGKALNYELRLSGASAALDAYVLPANAPLGYVDIPLNIPAEGVAPDGRPYRYSANDASVGDVDGDGQYEIVLKWEPTNAHDNAHNGYTGNVFLDCYKLSGKQLWRIDLGRNVRAGAHYTQFQVFDLDGDGKAEVVMKTSDGTVDGQGNVIGDAAADYRQHERPYQGRILVGNEYLTVFNGETGAAMQSVDYVPERGDLMGWGDNHANRSDRYLATVAYLDGERPSVVMCRGYYTRTVLAAWDWDGWQLRQRWVFDSNDEGNGAYAGQGNHNLRVADVDGDGCDEIIYGQMAVDHDGRGLYTTRMGHGDAMHLTAFFPNDNTLQVWGCHENKRDGSTFRDARTGKVLFQVPKDEDVGRCMAADIDPTNWGLEMWSSLGWNDPSAGIMNVKGEVIARRPRGMSVNFAVWWDGDLLRELLDRNAVSKYDWTTGTCKRIKVFEGCAFNNGTKSNPCLSGDIVGDWREEVLVRTADNSALRLYTTTLPTDYRFHTFLEDIPYRICLAHQNTAYNQPPQVGFYFGSDLQKGSRFRGCLIR